MTMNEFFEDYSLAIRSGTSALFVGVMGWRANDLTASGGGECEGRTTVKSGFILSTSGGRAHSINSHGRQYPFASS